MRRRRQGDLQRMASGAPGGDCRGGARGEPAWGAAGVKPLLCAQVSQEQGTPCRWATASRRHGPWRPHGKEFITFSILPQSLQEKAPVRSSSTPLTLATLPCHQDRSGLRLGASSGQQPSSWDVITLPCLHFYGCLPFMVSETRFPTRAGKSSFVLRPRHCS